jgi:colanic acid biosynthesis glycosyl transferase WcaI
MSRILIVSPNYAPEPIGVAPLVTDASEWLVERGHTVEVVTAMPNYPERRIHPGYRGSLWRTEHRGGVDVHRAWLRVRPRERLADKALYETSLAATQLPLLARAIARADAVVAVVPTMVSAAATATAVRLLARSRPRFVVWWQDLVFAGARAVVSERAQRGLERAHRLERAVARAADRVVTCSPGFADYLHDLGVNHGRVEVVFNWVDTERIAPVARAADGVASFLYAGNLGYSQGFETLAEAIPLLREHVRIRVVGEGNAAADVRRLVATFDNTTVEPPVPPRDFPALLGTSDVHLLLQRAVSAHANLPSKIAPYLASGRPVVASIAEHTPAADLLRASGGAVVVPPEDPQALAKAMDELAADPALRRRLAERGRAYAVERLDRGVLLPQLERAILG